MRQARRSRVATNCARVPPLRKPARAVRALGSTGGAAGSGTTLDVGDFCCPEYVLLMNEKIFGNWNQKAEVAGLVIVKFTVQRDGRLTAVAVEQSSGYEALDLAARRAVELTRQLTPLPAAYTNPTLTVHVKFPYQR